MPTITLDVPEELSELMDRAGDRLPELLALSLKEPALSAHIYRYILDFLASQPTPEQIAAFGPTPEMAERASTLVAREKSGEITEREKQELDEYERIEHLMIMIKAGKPPLSGRKALTSITVSAEARRLVAERAGFRCEYCQLPSNLAFFASRGRPRHSFEARRVQRRRQSRFRVLALQSSQRAAKQ